MAEYSTAAPPQNPTTNYTATDQLGSPRVITNALGQVTSRRDFMPFGEELYPDTVYRKTTDKYGATDSVRQRFTGYQKDTETGLDFAEARMYENRHGRFTAVDPLLASGKSANPQTFNRYVYVLNNPLILTDPTGLQVASDENEIVARIHTVWDRIKNIFYEAATERSNYLLNGATNIDSLDSANYQRIQNRINVLNGDPNAGEALSRRFVGNQGPTVDSVLQQTNESYQATRTTADYGFLASNLILGAAGMVGPGSASITTNRGISLSSNNPFARAAIAKEEFARANPGIRRSAIVGTADPNSNLSGAATNTLEPPIIVGPIMQANADRAGGLGTIFPGTRNRVGCCAEFNAANNLELQGANPNNLVFTRPERFRPTGGFIPVCVICQTWTSPRQFPSGTEFK